ncbi:MAG: alpha/beta hydrolase domain-containing protein [Vicinamibacterales bacterium]
MKGAVIVLGCLLVCCRVAAAEVVGVTITGRSLIANGEAFGRTGAYEKLVGTIEFALDPTHPRNAAIVDLGHAPRAADGKVHFTSDLYVLRPADASRGNGTLLFEVANRGNKLLFGYFQGARGPGRNDPTSRADVGDGFLMREGYTIVWVGWQFDVAPPQVGVQAPPVDMGASPTPDVVRFSFVPDEATRDVSPRDWPRYLPSGPDDPTATLTVRDLYWDTPTPLPRTAWRIVETADRLHLVLDSGFEPGRVYEVSYRARGAVVAGVGLAALRDTASAFVHRADLPVSGRTAFIFGASQSGRLLRQFLKDGFNVDEENRRVFALAWPHIAGAGLGSFNERFAMPGYSSFPATRAPYDWPGILAAYAPGEAPAVVATNTSVEYWGQGRAAALTHTSLDGRRDLVLPDNVRIYLLAGTQHGEAPFPAPQGNGQQRANPTPQVAAMHAVLKAAHAWVVFGAPPLESRYPRLSDRSLVAVGDLQFPSLKMGDPATIEGPGHVVDGRFSALPFLVPAVDADGNERAGIRVPDLAVPLATVTGWNFRAPAVGNPTTIYALLGSYVPFPRTPAERQASRDPRVSIEERYPSRDAYLAQVRVAAEALTRDRYLLADDLDSVLERARAHWDDAHGTGAR